MAGFEDYQLSTVFHQWMGGFPENESMAYSVICWGAAAAAMSGATKVIVKTPHEAAGVPTKETNRQGLQATAQILNMVREQNFQPSEDMNREIGPHQTRSARGDVQGVRNWATVTSPWARCAPSRPV